MKRNVIITLVLLFTAGLMIAGCSNESVVQPESDQISLKKVKPTTGTGSFTIEAKYTHIRSSPLGGGIFVVRLVPGGDLVGDIALSLSARRALGASLDRTIVNAENSVFEITVYPTETVKFKTYTINLTASNNTGSQTLALDIELIDWGNEATEIALQRRDAFVNWLETEHPELGNFSDRTWFTYMTYPEILIVEHYTFLDADWEFRMCHHVMIPPDDWAKMRLRPRGEWDPTLAAYRESDGTIYEIPVSEYPILFGY